MLAVFVVCSVVCIAIGAQKSFRNVFVEASAYE
jgi:hypothetical protein